MQILYLFFSFQMAAAVQTTVNPAPAYPTQSAPTRSVCVDRDTTRGMANVLLVSEVSFKIIVKLIYV